LLSKELSNKLLYSYLKKHAILLVIIGMNSTVTWKNLDYCGNTIIEDTELFRSEPLGQNQTWSYTFTKEGIYHYHTEPHPWLQGNIVVVSKEPSSAERIVIYDQNLRFANINDIEPNSAYVFFYPNQKDDAWFRWLLIRLPESLGGDKNDASAFRAYSMVDIRLNCLVQYWPDKLHLIDPCHGTFYDVLNGVAVRGPAVDYNFPNNALPKLDLGIDNSGFLYVKTPRFTVDANGVIGNGRIPDVKSIQLGSREIPVSKPDLHEIPERLPIFKVKDSLQKYLVAEAPLRFSPLQAIDKVLLLADFGIKHELSDLQRVIIDKINIEYPDNMNTNSYLVPYYKMSGRLIMPNEEINFERTLKAAEYKIPTRLEVELYPKDLYGNFDDLSIKGFLKGDDNQPVRFSTIMLKFYEVFLGTDMQTDWNGCFYFNDWNKNFVKKIFDRIEEKGALFDESQIEVTASGNEDYNSTSVSETIHLFRIAPPSMPLPIQLYSIDLLENRQPVEKIFIEKSETLQFELLVKALIESDQTVLLTTKNVPCDIDLKINPEALDLRKDFDAKTTFRISAHADKSVNYRIALIATNEKGDLLAREWIDVSILP